MASGVVQGCSKKTGAEPGGLSFTPPLPVNSCPTSVPISRQCCLISPLSPPGLSLVYLLGHGGWVACPRDRHGVYYVTTVRRTKLMGISRD